MADNEKFTYDPEGDQKRRTRFLRLPFALCKKNGIEVQKWWRPRDAWAALKREGYVNDPSDEMKKMLVDLKKKEDQKRRKEQAVQKRARKEAIARQESQDAHIPEKDPNPGQNFFANVKKGNPMTHESADSGNVNPFYADNVRGKAIGYQTNCQTCAAAYIARLQGYDVSALPNLNNEAIYNLSRNAFSVYENPGTYAPKYGGRKMSFLNRMIGEGEVHQISFTWGDSRMGHTVIVMKNAGKITLYDPQDNSTTQDVAGYLYGTKNLEMTGDLRNVKIKKDIADKIFKPRSKTK